MVKGIIQVCSRKTIDTTSTNTWDKYVFDDTYREFLMQAQQFDQQKKYATFQDILKNLPKADQMHYLVSTAAVGYIRQLNEKIPEAVNVFSKPCVPFKKFRFEIVQSHVMNRDQHKVAIYFYSEPLIWIESINSNQLLFALGDQSESLSNGNKVDTEVLVMSPNLTICSYQQHTMAMSQAFLS